MFKQAEIVLTTLYLVLSVAMLAAMAFRIRAASIKRAARISIWDKRVGGRLPGRQARPRCISPAAGTRNHLYPLDRHLVHGSGQRVRQGVVLCGALRLDVPRDLLLLLDQHTAAERSTAQAADLLECGLAEPADQRVALLADCQDAALPADGRVRGAGPTRARHLASRARRAPASSPTSTLSAAMPLMSSSSARMGRLVDGSDLVVTNWYGYDEPVYAPAEGQIVTVVDGFPCRPIGDGDTVNLAGNHVVIDIGSDRQVFLAHLVAGSVAVKEGEYVSSGTLIGRVGNSGNSEAPHLHLHVQSASGTMLPFRFRSMQRERWLLWIHVTEGYLLRNDRFRG